MTPDPGTVSPHGSTPVLAGPRITLEPLATHHAAQLAATLTDPVVWAWMPRPRPSDQEQVADYIADRLLEHAAGTAHPYVIVANETGTVIGSTSLYEIDQHHSRAVLGWTWLDPSQWGTGANDESKALLLDFAFDNLELARIEVRTDALNTAAQTALSRLGFSYEGTLRSNMRRPDGTLRDSRIYSVLRQEWPELRTRWTARLTAESSTPGAS